MKEFSETIGENLYLSLYDTNVLKGLAICLMLIHHLFWIRNGLYDDIQIGNLFLVNVIGQMAKVCVAIFVFLSGYGLVIQSEKRGSQVSLSSFYIHRFKKLFLNYWFIWLIFVPISYFCFDMTFYKIYHTNIGWHLFADILGLHNLIFQGTYCYNPTWWFYSCIITLYLLYPLMYYMMKRDLLTLLLLTLILSLLPIPFIEAIKFYIIAFALGMCMVNSEIPSPIRRIRWLMVLLMLLYAVGRLFCCYPYLIDSLLTLFIVRLYKSVNWPKKIISIMAFLGKHSMNIFLFHTFIFYFWFQNIIYASRNPIFIFFTLLAICIPISIVLEWMKRYTIYKL